jgi:hypothetical protein
VLLFVFSTLIPPFFSGIVGCGSAYLMLRITRAYSERKAGEGDEKTWRQARLDAEKSLRDMLADEKRERMQWQLVNEGNLAKIADILEESTQAQQLLASIAARMDSNDSSLKRHDGDIIRLWERLDKMHDHITSLAFSRHDKSA